MKFKFSYRPYSGQEFRPTPEVHIDEKVLIVATPWGQRDAAKKVIDRILGHLALCADDHEATTPFQRLSCLSPSANNLRIAALVANESLYREENSREYRLGVELFSMFLSEGDLVWLQIGQPQVLLARKSRRAIPLGGSMDLSFDLSENERLLPSLPHQLLGIETSVNLTINSFRPKDQDQIILLSHSQLPSEIFQGKSHSNNHDNKLTLDEISRKLSENTPQLAFWLGLVELSENLS